jgi:hypothetical protein
MTSGILRSYSFLNFIINVIRIVVLQTAAKVFSGFFGTENVILHTTGALLVDVKKM